MIAKGDRVKHALTGTELVVEDAGSRTVVMRITKPGMFEGKPTGKVGDTAKTVPASIGKTYEVLTDVLEEENTTGNLDGGEGQPRTPYAFSKKGTSKGSSIAKKSGGFTQDAPDTHRWGVKWESIDKTLDDLNEISYRSFKQEEGSDKAKINRAIKEAYRRVLEAEKLITNASKLKTEVGADQKVFWKQSSDKFYKLAERLNRLGAKLRELNK